MRSDVLLQAEHLHVSYDDGASYALQDLSLEIKRGRKTAIMGANGSGKSTFFRCCVGISRPQLGTLFWNGRPVRYDRKSLRALRSKVGIVFQDPDNQLCAASVTQEISFGPLNLGIPEPAVRAAVEAVMEALDLTPLRHKPTQALSTGQKKQVSIADILVMGPELMILDEPAAALDPKHTKLVYRTVDQLTEQGITVVMSTHDVNYAYGWADEVILLRDGRVLQQGAPQQIFGNRALLEQAHLEPPTVLRVFQRLCGLGILDPALPAPRTIEALEAYLATYP